MSKELFYLIDQIAREKGVSKDVLIEALSTALLSAAKKKLDGRENLKVEVDESTFEIKLYETKAVVDEVEDGNLELLGRIDNQVKIRGHRIELGEIEARLRHHPAVREGVVVTKTDPSGEKRLVAYVVEEADAPSDAPFGPAVRTFLAAELPDYMVPVLFVSLDAYSTRLSSPCGFEVQGSFAGGTLVGEELDEPIELVSPGHTGAVRVIQCPPYRIGRSYRIEFCKRKTADKRSANAQKTAHHVRQHLALLVRHLSLVECRGARLQDRA